MNQKLSSTLRILLFRLMTNTRLFLTISVRNSLHFTLRLGSMMTLLETPSLAVSLTGGEEHEGDRHAIMIIIIINNIKQRQKRSGERETMITIKTTGGMEENNK